MSNQWNARTNMTEMHGRGGDMWTPIQGPKFAFDVITPPCVDKVEHHALVEGIATAINSHDDLVRCVEHALACLEPKCDGQTIVECKAVLAKAKGSP